MSKRFSFLRYPLAAILALVLGTFLASRSHAAELSVKLEPVFTRAGPVRNATYCPGDVIIVSVSMDGLETNKAGAAKLRLTSKLLDDAGETIGDNPLVENEFKPGFGGASLGIVAAFHIPPDALPGLRQVSVEVVDVLSGKSVSARLPVEVAAAKGPYLVQLRYASDTSGMSPVSGNMTLGEHLFLHYRLMGLRNDDDRRYTCTLQFIEEDKVCGETLRASVNGNSLATASIPAQFFLTPNREFNGVALGTHIRQGRSQTRRRDSPARAAQAQTAVTRSVGPFRS